jgi:exosortase
LEAPSAVGSRIPEQRAESVAPIPGGGADSVAGRGRPVLWAGLAALVLLALLAALYAGILRDLAWQWWDDSNYTHGFLVPIFSGVLIWQRRKQLAALPAEGTWIGLPVLLLGIGALLLGDVGSENFLMRSSLIVILVGLVLFHLGSRVFRVVAFPLLFLFFMVPLPATLFYAVAFPLQNLAARNAAWTLDMLGVPVLLDGNIIHLTKQSLGVAEACSGIRSLISLFSVAVAWAVLTLPGFWARAVFVAAVVPITILANAGRVVITGLIGQWFGVEYAQGFFHTFSSWLVFVFAFLGLLGVFSAIRRVEARRNKRTL